MHASVTVTPAQLPELLLHVAVVRPVFIWGQPGIGKSSLVEEFAAQVGLECCTLLGTQLAAEDLIGVPRITGEGDQARTTQLAHRAKALLTELAEISVEAAQMVVAGAQDGVTEDGSDARLPSWFMVEVVRDLPRLAAARDGAKV
jgi:hypothetical protein